MPSDEDLARARLSGSEYAVALAVRAIMAGGAAPTIERVIEMTGLSKTAVYDARNVLRARWPDKYGTPQARPVEIPQSRKIPQSRNGAEPPDTDLHLVPTGPEAIGDPTPARIDAGRLALGGVRVPSTPEAAPAVWRQVLEGLALAAPADRRSWDVYVDAYGPAWDRVLAAVPEDRDPTGELIALTTHYVETVTGEPVTGEDRKVVAMLVRQFGKAGLYGISKALGATDGQHMRDWYRYARQVAARTVADLRTTTEEA